MPRCLKRRHLSRSPARPRQRAGKPARWPFDGHLYSPRRVFTSASRAEGFMLDDASRALNQMLSPPLRAVLWKSIGLALALIVAVGVALDRLIAWLLGAGSAAVETGLGPHAHT